ncbi:MAG: hypothetical protein HY589_01175 [Candidatus Omnitrophica bacterium]|nr:hypothetical protein [Candidatus Omnitrophota bacterium]
MKVMEAVGKAFELAGKNMGLWLFLCVFNILWNLVPIPFLGDIQNAAAAKISPSVVALSLAFILVNIFVQGGVFGIIKDNVVSRSKFTVGNFVKYGGKFYLKLLSVGLMILLGILLAALIIGLIFSVSLVIRNLFVNIIAVSISVILLLVALYFLLLFFLSPYILVMDDLGVFKAMSASLGFVKNNLWKVTALLTVLILIGIGIGVITSAIAGMLSLPLKGTAFQAATGVITGAANAYITIIISAAFLLYYHGVSAGGREKEAEKITA